MPISLIGANHRPDFSNAFVTHEAMSALNLRHNQPQHELAAWRFTPRIFWHSFWQRQSGILRVQEHGPYQLRGDKDILDGMDILLSAMVKSGRMRMSGDHSVLRNYSKLAGNKMNMVLTLV